jgi:hypothetical protein
VLDAGGFFSWIVFIMKTKIFAALLGVAVIATGCIQTVSGTRTAAVTWSKDQIQGRYQRSPDQVYQAAVTVIQTDGVLITEFIPHDVTNTVRSLEGKVNQRNVWIRVEGADPKITTATVQARSKMGVSDVDLAAQIQTEIALQLSR